ncbi:MAG: hypothetical protein WA099_10520 [Sulfuricurvum sp.]
MKISFSNKLSETIYPFKNTISQYWPKKAFLGWGRRKYGRLAQKCAKLLGWEYLCIEDGFIRSLGLGDDCHVYSIVVDDCGIYYDATTPSRLENLLLYYDFSCDSELIQKAKLAMALIKEHSISKYNHAPCVESEHFGKHHRKRVLIIAQTSGDMSLKYGMAEQFTTDDLINAAIGENPDADIFLKIHPDVLAGKKLSDVDVENISSQCILIDYDVNPISLLIQMDKVYTKTSQMGFEALLLGKECVCFGMPFYAGWGLTDDRLKSNRRSRGVTIFELFAASYILYPLYFDPIENKPTDIIGTIQSIINRKKVTLL